jgi:hypothetical protein
VKSRLAVLATCVGLLGGAGGCAKLFAPSTLARADDRLAAAEYRSAASLYDQFLRERPNDPDAPRARATRAMIERLLGQQAEIERLKAEATRLRADLERLRNIDLRQTPPVR